VQRRAVPSSADAGHAPGGVVGVGVGDLREDDDAPGRVARGAGDDGRDDSDELALVEGVGLLLGGWVLEELGRRGKRRGRICVSARTRERERERGGGGGGGGGEVFFFLKKKKGRPFLKKKKKFSKFTRGVFSAFPPPPP